MDSKVRSLRITATLATVAIGALMFCSTASATPVWGDKPGWIRYASDQMINNFPAIDAFMWFNIDKERDWRVDTDPDVLQAYRESWTGLEQGVHLDGYPTDLSVLDTFETDVQQHQARVGWFESLDTPFPTASVVELGARGTKPFIVWEPFDGSAPGETARTGDSRLDDILRGDYDPYITAWAQAAAATGVDLEISFGHEMNGDWFTWGYLNGHNANTAQMHIDAFRYVHGIFAAEGATNVDWVWTINASWTDDFSVAYPGSAYVDRMGMNGFNWAEDPNGGGPDYAKWRQFENIFGWWDPFNPSGVNNYEALLALDDKPIIIGEMAVATPAPSTLALLLLGGLAVRRRRPN